MWLSIPLENKICLEAFSLFWGEGKTHDFCFHHKTKHKAVNKTSTEVMIPEGSDSHMQKLLSAKHRAI